MGILSTYWRRLQAHPTVRRLQQAPAYYGHGLYQQLMHKDIFLWAQAIAFKVLITIVPVIILATGVLGQVLQREKPFEAVANFIRTFLPPENSEQIIRALRQLSSVGDIYTIVGVIGLLISALTLFTTLRVAVGNVFQEEWHENRSILGGYLFDLRLVGQVGLFFILTFGVSLAVQTLNSAGFEFIEKVGLDYVWVREGWRRALKTLGLVIPFFLSTAMFFQLLFFVPKPHPPKRSALAGALFTAVLWEAAKSGFTIYAANIGRFDRYVAASSGEPPSGFSLGNTFGLIIAFVFWVYFSGIVLLLGAIVALLHEKAHRSRRQAALAEAGSAPVAPTYPASEMAASEKDMPEIATPEKDMPEMAASEMAASEMAASEMAIPEIATPEQAASEMAASEKDMPEQAASEMAASEMDIPEIATPEQAASEMAASEMDIPEIATPEQAASEMDMPEMDTPEIATPEKDMPEMAASEMAASEMAASEMAASEKDMPEQAASEMAASDAEGDTLIRNGHLDADAAPDATPSPESEEAREDLSVG